MSATKRNVQSALCLMALSMSGGAISAEREAAAIAYTCAGCHGPEGQSQGAIPSIAGGEADDLYKKLSQYKSEELSGTIMTRIAKGYSDEMLRAVADHFAKVK